jgi:iron complex outermembrane receptor protein
MNKSNRAAKSWGALLLACTTRPLLAQDVERSTSSIEAGVDEIIVTAQRRVERLQDVPVSVTAISGEALRNQRIDRVDDLVSKVPNLQFISTVGDSTPIFSLRGVSMADFSLNQASPVATYYDEVYKGNFAILGIALYDLERVEVLRGPQGTLYGKNTTGGAINLISKRPTFDTEGYIDAGYGNYSRTDVSGMINLPITPELAVRLAGTYSHADGWYKNRLAGQPDLQSIDEYGFKGSALWEPSEGVSFLLRASTSGQRPWNYGGYAAPGPNGVGAGVYEMFGSGTSYFRTGLGVREIESNNADRRKARTYAVSLTGNITLSDGLAITSVTSWDKGRLSFDEETDGSPNQTLEISYTDRVKQVAQDVRLASEWSGPFNFILGAYYNREKVFNATNLGFFRDLDVNADGSITAQDCLEGFPIFACNIRNSFDQIRRSYALYGDFRYDLAQHLTVRGGLRYTHDKGEQINLNSEAVGVDGVLVMPLLTNIQRFFKTNNLSGKVGLDYKPSDGVLIYGSYSRGYRAPAFNAQAFFDMSEASVAKAEKIQAFEMGAKAQFWARRITLNVAGFYYKYNNQQFLNVDPQTATQTLINVERSIILGGEVELNARVFDSLSLRMGLGLLDTKVKKGALGGNNIAGNKLLTAPSVSFSGGLDFTAFDGSAGKLSFHPELTYISSQFFEVQNLSRLKQDGYALLNGTIRLERGPLTFMVWGKNLTDKIYATSRVDTQAGFGFDFSRIGTPRTYGASARYTF